MATQAEIEAAAQAGYEQRIRAQLHVEAGQSINPRLEQRTLSWAELPDQEIERSIARAALEAAERVRAEALPAKQDAATRARRYRARKRDGRDATLVTAVTESVTAVTAAAPDVTTVTPLLLASLIEAAGGNVAPGAVDVAPIQVLLAHGCDLDLDVLPVLREIATSQTPIKRWDHPGLIRAILRGRDIRIAPKAPLPSPPARQHSPGVPRFDMDELVAGYRAGNVDWDTNRLGPPPGAPGCRVDASILRENGY
jgi:hypothetical protein